MKVVIDQTISIDGFIAGPDDGPENALGTGAGPKLFDWYQGGEIMYGDDKFAPRGRDRDAMTKMHDAYGAFVTGRRTYDITNAWGGTHPLIDQVVVLTHRPATPPSMGRSKFAYVDNIKDAVSRAKERAGDRDVAIGTAAPAQLALDAGLVDEIWLHVAPLVLGNGRSLFANRFVQMTPIETIAGPGATHIRYRVER